jgi:uncharacterized protein DUF4915
MLAGAARPTHRATARLRSGTMKRWSRLREELSGRRIVVSGFGKWGGGVYDITEGRPRALDDIPTSGLGVGPDRLWRVLRAPGEQTASCELLEYDVRGVASYRRLDAVRDPHDVCHHDGRTLVSSSWDATVWDVTGEPRPLWQGGSVPDSWHVNSLVVVDGRLHVCAFGRFERHKAWKGEPGQGAGFVHDVERGEDILTGLDRPHCPRRHDGRWYVCESTRGFLTELDLDGTVLRRALVRRFTRGLAIAGRWALVGGNAHRESETDRAEIALVDLDSFTVVETLAMPCLEVYDIALAPAELVRGLAAGFAANPARAVEQHRRDERADDRRAAPPSVAVGLATPEAAARMAASGRTLERSTRRRCRVEGAVPTEMAAGEVRLLDVTVHNDSELVLASVSPRPVRVGARWSRRTRRSARPARPARPAERRSPGADDLQNPRAALPHAVLPGHPARMQIVLEAPDEPGVYRVVVGLHQPGTGWFGSTRPVSVTVTVTAEAA